MSSRTCWHELCNDHARGVAKMKRGGEGIRKPKQLIHTRQATLFHSTVVSDSLMITDDSRTIGDTIDPYPQ